MSNYYFFDEMQQTGHKIRMQNKLKALSLMALSVNFTDPEVLKKIQNELTSLTPEEMKAFKDFLNGRKFLDPFQKNTDEQKIIDKITKIALMSMPKDEYLNKLFTQYKNNLNKIDSLKIETTKTNVAKEISGLIEQIHDLNEENCQLIEKVNAYRESQPSNIQDKT